MEIHLTARFDNTPLPPDRILIIREMKSLINFLFPGMDLDVETRSGSWWVTVKKLLKRGQNRQVMR
uniref:Uncharacterized protein n=1 Tax=Candidatus Kentrum sp. FM TaxID=2126340 RepID=A0A450T1X2_9GAMM|nr:MAG: hypothetical protein BECKFM1743A_GA0114220_102654 [Candidatus Kentron sp. FM]VFK13376.1 MAG: hypothetical protein BECKFM1743B_GA0114221_102784 [Candidatus Kentron sp. FM]